MDLGISRDKLMVFFAAIAEVTIKEIKESRSREAAVSMGEFPTELLFRKFFADKLDDLSPEEKLNLFFISLLKVIDANNKLMAQQLEPYLKGGSGK